MLEKRLGHWKCIEYFVTYKADKLWSSECPLISRKVVASCIFAMLYLTEQRVPIKMSFIGHFIIENIRFHHSLKSSWAWQYTISHIKMPSTFNTRFICIIDNDLILLLIFAYMSSKDCSYVLYLLWFSCLSFTIFCCCSHLWSGGAANTSACK